MELSIFFTLVTCDFCKRGKNLGDHLTVAVSSDEFNSIKGKKLLFLTLKGKKLWKTSNVWMK